MSLSLQPIVLWTPTATLASDEACTTILQYTLASSPSVTQAPYYRPHTAEASATLSYVPPLAYFCIKSLLQYPDQLHVLGPARLLYEHPTDGHDFDILQALIPTYRPFSPHHANFDLRVVDPRLWAVLAQIYEGLPGLFRQYTIPLSDVYLPLLQTIPSTDHFTLVTVLSLARCRELTDDTVLELRHLHTLAALDASVTALGTWGVQRLAKSLSWTDGGNDEQRPERRGPWGLRVLYLKDCINIDDKVLDCLSQFPLLSVVDLRGTACTPWQHETLAFSSSSDTVLFQPGALSKVLAHLANLTKKPRTLFSHPAPYVLNVDSLHHKADPTPSYHLPSNLWGIERPDTRPPDKSRVQVARHGRTDVFLPYTPKEPQYESSQCDCLSCCRTWSYSNELYTEEEEGDDEEEDAYGMDRVSRHMYEDGVGLGSTPRSSPEADPATWMNEVADEELTLYQKQRSVDKFYAPGPRGAMSLSGLPGRGDGPLLSLSESALHAPPDPHMLFRTPPPWSALPSSPPGKAFSTRTSTNAPSSDSPPSPKRRRVEDTAPADQARKSMHALSSIRSMFNMVQKRAADSQAKAASTTQSGGRRGAPGNISAPAQRNPFARPAGAQVKKAFKLNMQPAGPLQSVAVDRANATSKSRKVLGPRPDVHTTAVAAGRASVPEVQKRHSTSDANPSVLKSTTPLNGSPSKQSVAHSSDKKLKPITSLTVPDWPGNMQKPLSAHKPKVPTPLQTKKQTTLPVPRDPVPPQHKPRPRLSDSNSVAAKAKAPTTRRLSAPAQVLDRRSSGPVEGTTKGKHTKPPSKTGQKMKGKTSSGGDGFDWKGWSAGS